MEHQNEPRCIPGDRVEYWKEKPYVLTVIALAAALFLSGAAPHHDGDQSSEMRVWKAPGGLYEIEGSFVLAPATAGYKSAGTAVRCCGFRSTS